jgi:hypothetical protein
VLTDKLYTAGPEGNTTILACVLLTYCRHMRHSQHTKVYEHGVLEAASDWATRMCAVLPTHVTSALMGHLEGARKQLKAIINSSIMLCRTVTVQLKILLYS